MANSRDDLTYYSLFAYLPQPGARPWAGEPLMLTLVACPGRSAWSDQAQDDIGDVRKCCGGVCDKSTKGRGEPVRLRRVICALVHVGIEDVPPAIAKLSESRRFGAREKAVPLPEQQQRWLTSAASSAVTPGDVGGQGWSAASQPGGCPAAPDRPEQAACRTRA